MADCKHERLSPEWAWDRRPIEDLDLIGALTNCALCGEPLLVWGIEDDEGNYAWRRRPLLEHEAAQLLLLGHKIGKMKAMKKVPDGRQGNRRTKQHSCR